MSHTITATFDDGVFRPDHPFGLPSGTRVRLVVDVCEDEEQAQDPSAELDRLCDEFPIDTGGVRLTRDQLHERR